MVGTGTNPRQEPGTGDPSRDWAHDEGWTYPPQTIEPPPWSERIPAAVKHAEELTQDGDYNVEAELTSYIAEPEERLVALTAGELALAKDACETWELETMKLYGGIAQQPPPALITFTEKVEALT